MANECRKISNPPPILPDQEMLDAIDEALQRAVERGVIVDSGERRWSERTGRYEIVWESKIFRRR
jgi:hypothetical protein